MGFCDIIQISGQIKQNKKMQKILKKKYKLLIFFSLLFAIVVSVLNAKNDSLIYDEAAHIPAGYSYLKTFDMRLNPEHPPLLKDLAALPLLFLDLNFDTKKNFWNENANDAQWEAGKYFLFNAGNDPDKIIFWSRLPIILIFILLGLFIFRWTREMSGLGAAFLAFILFVFDPNFLGHNHYVTTDMGIAAFITFVFYYFIKFLKDPSWKNVWIFTIFLSLVQLVKFSSVLIFPVFGLILTIYSFVRLAPYKQNNDFNFKIKTFAEYLGKFIIALGVSLIIVWIAYYFTTFNMPKEKLPEITNFYFNKDNIQAIFAKKIIFALNENSFFRPMAVYIFGIFRVFQRVVGGNVTYLFGEISTSGFFSYFPLAFLLKTPIPTLALILGASIISFCNIFNIFGKKPGNKEAGFFYRFITFSRAKTADFLMLIFIFIYSFTSITGKLNIGFRHLFPIFPFIFILTAKTIFSFIEELENKKVARFAYSVVFVFAAMLIINTVNAYPNYLSYFNAFAGGPKNGYKYITDSNADWGQDLKRLQIFLNSHPEIDKIRLNYFGTANEAYYLGEKYIPWWDARKPLEPGWYGISVLFLQESIYDPQKPENQSYRWLKNKKPDYQIGASILIYHISKAETEKVNSL